MRKCEDGYALVAAVASIAVFSAMALTVLSATRMGISDAGAEQAQLQANAAADAGFAMALQKLLDRDATQRWSIDGRVRTLTYGQARLRVRIEDERGKVPISRLDEKLATRLLEEVGLSGDNLLIARDSLLDWTDSDDEARPFGAEAPYYQSAGISPPNGFLGSIEELRSVRGFDARTVERIKPLATAYTAMAAFEAQYANPRAMAIMEEAGGKGGAVTINRARELAGQRTAIELTDTASLTGRPLTIIVDAALPDGARAIRRIVVELTGVANRPYFVRAYE
ncbi:general secretion pathway protein GspK [Sphingomonas sp. QA11]|uniref:general secretion pathway protein GspK n=1 Tax=Sphingomonas sp. QA11 TaxID=2950605 RepID=UPI0023496322|nr:type II secretion system protein GspK [Sphingomonas sp. QA11]WCM29727.1 general secretion pathway protein GspK [Sphingomonas sp. QA11]